jgi:hypothetical protein
MILRWDELKARHHPDMPGVDARIQYPGIYTELLMLFPTNMM